MAQFHETVMGRQFFESTMPRILHALERIDQDLQRVADALEVRNIHQRQQRKIEESDRVARSYDDNGASPF